MCVSKALRGLSGNDLTFNRKPKGGPPGADRRFVGSNGLLGGAGVSTAYLIMLRGVGRDLGECTCVNDGAMKKRAMRRAYRCQSSGLVAR